MKKSYSQTKQDIWVVDFYKGLKNGYFLDIGGCFAEFDNNTFLLEKKYGWSGIIVEPQTRYHEEIRQKRKALLECRAIWSNNKGTKFCINRIPGLSGILETNRTKTPHIVDVETITFGEILEKYNCPNFIHYVSLDIEGAEFEALKTFPFNKYVVGVWTIEHGLEKEKDKNITQLLLNNGYLLDRYNKQDFYWVHESISGFDSRPIFSSAK